MEKGIWQTIEGKEVFIEFGQDISKQIIEQLNKVDKPTEEIEISSNIVKPKKKK